MTENGATTRCKVKAHYTTNPTTKPMKDSGETINFMVTALSITTLLSTLIKTSISIVLTRSISIGNTTKVKDVVCR